MPPLSDHSSCQRANLSPGFRSLLTRARLGSPELRLGARSSGSLRQTRSRCRGRAESERAAWACELRGRRRGGACGWRGGRRCGRGARPGRPAPRKCP
eukprot:3157584-Rhodomonas_salina.3